MRAPGPESTLRGALRNGAQLAALSALALGQPVFDILGRNPAFFAVRGSTSGEILLFAAGLTLVPPVALVLVELGCAAFSRTLARVLHVFFVGGFVALFALFLVAKNGTLSGAPALVAAAAIGSAAAVAFLRTRAAGTFLLALSPVPLVFVALFLVNSPVSKLVFVEAAEVHAATVQARTPVVLIVFDEFSTVSLMNRRQGIDAGRYPNFAALARDSTWFRSATTLYWLSEVAVPSILAGIRPEPDRLPVLSDYPQNLFTLLGGSYRIRAVETLTHLCPREYCRDTAPAQAQAVSAGIRSLASDAGTVYLHMVLPEPYTRHIPPIDDAWGNFGRHEERDEGAGPRRADGTEPCARNVCLFSDLISADRKPTLYFLHSLLPHVPYVYLPSGRRYAVEARPLHGLETGFWQGAWRVLVAQQRYLLQLAYTDRALGVILRRLRETGVYDRALVIVTADHGVSFRRGDRRRLPTTGNLDDVAFVPLFVKLPGQRKGKIVDSLATTLDILPTIAHVLGVQLQWRVHGKSLVGRALPADGTVGVFKQDRNLVEARLSTLRARRSQTLRRQVARFGTGSVAGLYRVGPYRGLLGRSVASLPVRTGGARRVELVGGTLFDAVDLESGLVPSLVEGKLIGSTAPRQALALAVNGRIAATTYAYKQDAVAEISALLPEDSLRSGRNTLDVFAVRGAGAKLVLEQLEGADRALALGTRGGREVIRTPAGKTIPIRPRALTGTVRVSSAETGFVFSGSAVRTGTGSSARSLVVFVGDRALYRAPAENVRPRRVLGQPDLGKHGFSFELPRGLLPAPGSSSRVRVFALGLGVASELRYLGDYPWAHE